MERTAWIASSMNHTRVMTHLVVLLGVLLLPLSACRGGVSSSKRPVRAEILEIIGPIRFSEGRLAGMRDYVPYAPGHIVAKLPTQRIRNLEVIKKRLQRNSSSSSLLAESALLSALQGRLEEATDQLKELLSRQPSNSIAANDLAAF